MTLYESSLTANSSNLPNDIIARKFITKTSMTFELRKYVIYPIGMKNNIMLYLEEKIIISKVRINGNSRVSWHIFVTIQKSNCYHIYNNFGGNYCKQRNMQIVDRA